MTDFQKKKKILSEEKIPISEHDASMAESLE
jgi:hypothetical protein